MCDLLNISILQYDIKWEDPDFNLNKISDLISENSKEFRSDLIILPEMFSTGFTMDVKHAETINGKTIDKLKDLSKKYDCAIFGSFMSHQNDRLFNRGFFITPEEDIYYDKKHLFRPGEETKYYSSGNEQVITCYKGWNIMLQICYDLRFPVWCRNVNNNYDLMLVAANWPFARQTAWDTLIRARAIENCSYVAAANRIGIDGNNLLYKGGSALINMKGEIIESLPNGENKFINKTISLDSLKSFRDKFPTWVDADKFILF